MLKDTKTEFRFEKIKDRSGKVTAFEILSDFEHPRFWRMNAMECFRNAERMWQKQEMDFLVIRNALMYSALMASRTSFSINVHPSTLVRPDFLWRLDSAVDESGIDPSRIVLELVESESDGMAYPEAVRKAAERIRARRISVAFDDFDPEGPHSLLALRSVWPVDVVKIDGRLVDAAKNGGMAEFESAARSARIAAPSARLVAERVSDLATYVLIHGCSEKVDSFQGRWEYVVPNGCKNVLFP